MPATRIVITTSITTILSATTFAASALKPRPSSQQPTSVPPHRAIVVKNDHVLLGLEPSTLSSLANGRQCANARVLRRHHCSATRITPRPPGFASAPNG